MAQVSLPQRLAARGRWGGYFQYERTVYILLLFTLGKGFQLSIAILTVNLYVKSLGYDQVFVGVFAAMSAIGALVAGVPVGFLADRMGRKPLLIISGFATPLTLVATALSASAPLLIASGLLNGIMASAYWVTNLPMLTEHTTEEQRVGALALNNFLLLGVGALGALIGGLVPQAVAGITGQPALSTIPLRVGVLAAAVAVFLPALPLVTIREPHRPGRHAPRAPSAPDNAAIAALPPSEAEGQALAQQADAEPRSADPTGRWGVAALFLKLLIPDALFTTGEGAIVGLLSLFFVFRFNTQPDTLGLLFTIAGLVGGATSLAAPRIVRRFGQLRMATTMQYASVPVILLIGYSPLLPLAATGEFGRQILRGLFEPVYAAFAMGRVSSRYRGRLSGFYSLTWSLGFSIGPITEGFLQRNVSLSTSFAVGAAMILLSATLLRVFFPREARALPKPSLR